MKNIQQTLLDLEELKSNLKDAKAQMKENYESVSEYNTLVESRAELNSKLKIVRLQVEEQFPELAMKIEDLKIDVASTKEMLNDIAMTMLLKGESIDVVDKYDQPCLPLFSIKFQKEN